MLVRYNSAVDWVPFRKHSVFLPVFRDQIIRYICAGKVPLRDQAEEWVILRYHSASVPGSVYTE